MGVINKPNTFSANTTISSSKVNANEDTIYNEFNGNISSANLATDAVVTAKIADSNVTTTKIADAAVTPAKWTNPYCFRARASVATTLTDGAPTRVTFGTEIYDYNNNFSSPTYTAPVAGVYTFSSVVGITNAATMVDCYLTLYVNGAASTRGGRYTMSADSAPIITCDVLLAANDTVEIYAYQNSAGNETSVANADETWFSGHLVHAV